VPVFCYLGSLVTRRKSNPHHLYPALCAAMNGGAFILGVASRLLDCVHTDTQRPAASIKFGLLLIES